MARVSCRGYSFSLINADDILAHIEDDIGPEDVEALNLSNNELSSCAGLAPFCRLMILDVSHNSIGHLSELARTITHLNVAYNKIERLSGLELLPNLEVLDASFNLLSDLRSLARNRKLKDVRVSGNRISVIEGLEGAKQLENLDIRHNLLEKMEDMRALSFNVKLHNLEIRGNPVVSTVSARELRITLMHLVPALTYMDGEKPPRSPRGKQASPPHGQRMKVGSYHQEASMSDSRRSLVKPFVKAAFGVDRVVDGEEEEEGAGGLPKLLKLLGHPRQDKVERALYVLRNSCLHSHANKETIREAGGFHALLSLLAPNRSSLILELSAAVLWHCAASAENRGELVEMGAVTLLVELLRAEGLPTRVVEALLGLLMALCEDGRAQEEVRASGGLATLVDVLDAPSALCQERAVAALSNLCEGNEANCRQVAVSGAVQRLAAFLSAAPSETLLCSTCLCLRAMSVQRIVLDAQLVLDPLVSLLEHPSPAVQDAAAAALTAYTESCPSRRTAPLLRRQMLHAQGGGAPARAPLGPTVVPRPAKGRAVPSSPTTSSYASPALRAAAARFSWEGTLRDTSAAPSPRALPRPAPRPSPRATPRPVSARPASGRSTPLRTSGSTGRLRVQAWTTDSAGNRIDLPRRSREIEAALAARPAAASPAASRARGAVSPASTPRGGRHDANSYDAWLHSLRGEAGPERGGPPRPSTPTSVAASARPRARSPAASSAATPGRSPSERTSRDFWAEALRSEYVRQHYSPRAAERPARPRDGPGLRLDYNGPPTPVRPASPAATPAPARPAPRPTPQTIARPRPAEAPAAPPAAAAPPPAAPPAPARTAKAGPPSPKGKSPAAPRPQARPPASRAATQGGWSLAPQPAPGSASGGWGGAPDAPLPPPKPRPSPPVAPLQATPQWGGAPPAGTTPPMRKSILKNSGPSPAPSPAPGASPAAPGAIGSPGTSGRRSAHESPDVSLAEAPPSPREAPAPAPTPAFSRPRSPRGAEQLDDILAGLKGVLTPEEEAILVRTIRETQTAIAASKAAARVAAV